MPWRALVLLPLLLLTLSATAQTVPATHRPIRPPAASTEEQRYQGADFPSWQITQALGTSTEPLRIAGTGVPMCIGWEAIVSFSADQRTCWCFTLDPNVRVAAPSADGGCRITDDYGRDGDGACFTTAANESKWKSPHWGLVATRPGSRGYPGGTGGVCTVATSTTQGFNSELRVPCRVDGDCTTVVGSGTCEDFTTLASGATRRGDVQYRLGCAYVVATPAAAATAWVEGGR